MNNVIEKQFSTLQLFSIVDGRLSTNIGDVYEMLNHIFGANLFTHELPAAMRKLEQICPDWFANLRTELQALTGGIEDFNKVVEILEANNKTLSIPQLTGAQRLSLVDSTIYGAQ